MALPTYIESVVTRQGLTLTQYADLSVPTGIGAPSWDSRLNIDAGDTLTLTQNQDEIVMDIVTSDVAGVRHWYLSWDLGAPATKCLLGMPLSGAILQKDAPLINMFASVLSADPFIYGATDNRVMWTAAGARQVVAGIESPISMPTGLPPEDRQNYQSDMKVLNHDFNTVFADVAANIHIGGYHGRRVRNIYDMQWPTGLPSNIVSWGFGVLAQPSRSARLVVNAPLFVATV